MRHVTSTGGVQIALRELGGTGRSTLLCHATGFHGAVLAPLAEALGGGFARWAIDFRAHGDSPVEEGCPLPWEDFAADVLAALDALGVAPGEALGIGHSMGGASLIMAEQQRPGTFAGLWVFEPITPPPGFRSSPEGGSRLAEGAARRRPSFPSHEAAVANFAAKPPLDVLRADVLEAYVRHGFRPGEDGAVHLTCRPEDEARIYMGGAAHAAFAHLPEVTCPVVVACGRADPGPARFAPEIADRLPHGRLQRFDELGHFGPLEDPAGCAEAVRAFAAGL